MYSLFLYVHVCVHITFIPHSVFSICSSCVFCQSAEESRMRAQHKHALATLHSQLQEEKADEESRIEEDRRTFLKCLSQKAGTKFFGGFISDFCSYSSFFSLNYSLSLVKSKKHCREN